MPDTVRQLGALQTLLGDNVSADISAQDVRDFLVSVYGPAWKAELGVTPAGETSIDEFDDDAFAGWTTLTITGNQTITERGGLLSVQPSGTIAVTDTNCILIANAIAIGDAVEVAVSGVTADSGKAPIFGPVITDGVTATDKMAWCAMQWFTNQITHVYPSAAEATLTANGLAGTSKGQNIQPAILYQRIEYDAANSFKSWWSVDKATWHLGYTMTVTTTPTHVGFGWNTGGAAAIAESFAIEYVRVVTV